MKVEGITYEYAAELLGVKKSTVQKHLERAVRKIEQRKNESLFLVL
ncbi:sigma factor-like helix-turn-helix DNA-binding protein [Heyndrickxia coagulans]